MKTNTFTITQSNIADFNDLIADFIKATKDTITIQNITEHYPMLTKSITFTTNSTLKSIMSIPEVMTLADSIKFNGRNVKISR